MKVPGSDGNSDAIKRVQEGRTGEPSVNRKGVVEKPGAGDARDGLTAQLTKSQSDKVTFSPLGATLRQELDPVKMAEERKAKIASLKERIQNGTYAPPSESIAQAFSEEISLEVMFSGGALQDGE